MNFKFRTLVNRHQDQVYSLALHILRDRSEAEDVAQEAYLQLWRNIESIELERAQYWLLKVTRNAAIDRIRKMAPQTVSIDESAPSGSESLEPPVAVAQQQLSRWLTSAIGRLKEPYKSLILLRDVQQKSYADVGHSLSLSHEQVKVYLHRARRQLRGLLQETES